MDNEDVIDGVRFGFQDCVRSEYSSINEMIVEGVRQGTFSVASNATSAPSSDFYYHVQKGVESWMNENRDAIIDAIAEKVK